MIADRIERDIRIAAPIEVVWAVVTEPEQIGYWFADVMDFDLTPGAEGTLTFSKYDPPSTINVKVERMEPPHHFAFRWIHPDGVEPDEANSTLVEFTLAREDEESTHLRLVESGIRGLHWDEAERERYFGDHSTGWDKCMTLLQEHVEQVVSG